jgi:hypothetical protein
LYLSPRSLFVSLLIQRYVFISLTSIHSNRYSLTD